ncbi:MAG: Maf family protein [Treponemataceae bacterium]
MKTLYLASSSPRRKQILDSVAIPFTPLQYDFDESYPKGLQKNEASAFIAQKKISQSIKIVPQEKDFLVLSADTLILLDNEILEKPQDKNEARLFLEKLSGKTHQTYTSLALFDSTSKKTSVKTSVNHITFRTLKKDEIEWYISTNEWHGAAAGYRIQGRASFFIQKIDGNFSSIMGLPLFELYAMLQKYDFFA